jgi:hypothetical protein
MTYTPVPGESQSSDHLRGVALALCVPLGVFGVHRFYTGKVGTGLLQLLTLGGCGLWWLADVILITAGEFRDSDGRRLTRWSRDDFSIEPRQVPSGRMTEEIETLQHEMHELVERVDFLERMLAQARDRAQLPGGGK